MFTLALFRHAKSNWDDPGLKDFDRPLARRGEAAAPRMGAFMAAQGIEPELILCSPERHADGRLRRGLLPGGGLTAAGPRAQGGGQRAQHHDRRS
jgi:hypothetical protein